MAMERKTISPDLLRERQNATFDTQKLTTILDGNEYFTERRKAAEKLCLDQKEFTEGPEYHFLSAAEKYDNAIRKSVHYMRVVRDQDLSEPADNYWFRRLAFPNDQCPLGLHLSMFTSALENQSTEEQKKKWVPRAKTFEVIGTYAQTEMGHGTFLRGLETTATYDPKTEEFIMHSPTLTSLKWWPGGLGKTCNHAVVMAVLHIGKQNYGTHAFICQLRHLDTHQPLPGIDVGDIGPKFGYEAMDNGFLRLDHYRIPRENMLMKNAEVTRDGQYINQSKSGKLSYGAMVFIRAMLVSDVCARGLAQASTIAVRYSCVRRQSELQPGAREPQVMDYQTQQYKLLPLLSTAYAYWFTGTFIRDKYFEVNYEIQQGNIEALPELHALSSGLKAFCSYGAMSGIEQCRLACGGHGFSLASGISKIYVDATPACTYEGENSVMYLQLARFKTKAKERSQLWRDKPKSYDELTRMKEKSKESLDIPRGNTTLMDDTADYSLLEAASPNADLSHSTPFEIVPPAAAPPEDISLETTPPKAAVSVDTSSEAALQEVALLEDALCNVLPENRALYGDAVSKVSPTEDAPSEIGSPEGAPPNASRFLDIPLSKTTLMDDPPETTMPKASLPESIQAQLAPAMADSTETALAEAVPLNTFPLYLVKVYSVAQRRGTLPKSMAYLAANPTSAAAACSFDPSFSLESLVTGYRLRANKRVRYAAERLAVLQAKGAPQHEAWNNNSVILTAAAEAHCHYAVVELFAEFVATKADDEREIQQVLTQLCQLYALYGITNNASDFMECGFLKESELDQCRDKVMSLLAALRVNAVALVDAFDYEDHMLGSALGRYDGNVYESIYEFAKKSSLNKTQVHESFHKYLKPFMSEKAKL